MSLDLAVWSLLLLLGLLGMVVLWRVPLRLACSLAGSTQDPVRGVRLEASMGLGPVRLELVRERAGGRLVSWCVRVFGRRLLEGARVAGARGTASSQKPATTTAQEPARPRRWTVALSWSEVATWLLERRERLRITCLDGRVAVGLDDPASTGAVYGLLCGLHALAVSGAHIEVQPVFDRELLDVNARAALELQLVPLLAGAAWLVVRHLQREDSLGPVPDLAAVSLPSSPGAP